jgi:hypothetical protein
MIIRREALQAVAPLVKPDTSHRCDKAQITPSGQVVATDGHVLLVASEKTRFPDAEFPSKNLPAYHGDLTEPVTLERHELDRLIVGSSSKQAKRTIPILGTVQIGSNGDGGFVAATDLLVDTVVRLKPETEKAGQFPVWERVLPRADKPTLAITLSATDLQLLAKAATLVAGKAKVGQITFYVPTESQHQGLDETKALAAGCEKRKTRFGDELIDPKTERRAASGNYPNGEIESAIRIEIKGADVQIVGAIAPFRRQP